MDLEEASNLEEEEEGSRFGKLVNDGGREEEGIGEGERGKRKRRENGEEVEIRNTFRKNAIYSHLTFFI